MVGGWSQSENNATLWLHLASWDLPDSQLSLESKMEPSVEIALPCVFILFLFSVASSNT